MAAPNNILEDFEQITRYDIRGFFVKFASYLEVNNPRVLSYYKGETNNVDTASFSLLKELTRDAKEILEDRH